MTRVEYKALRKISGAYHGSSHDKLSAICGVEPLQVKLDDTSISWAASVTRTRDTHIREPLTAKTPKGHSAWDDGTHRMGFKTDPAISSAFQLSTIPDYKSMLFEDRDSTEQDHIKHTELVIPKDDRSRHKGYWAGTIGG